RSRRRESKTRFRSRPPRPGGCAARVPATPRPPARSSALAAALARRVADRPAADLGEGGEQLDELAVDLRVAGDDLALVEEVGLAGEVADQPAGFGDEERPGGDVPRRQAGFEEAVVPAGGDVAEVERSGAWPAHAGADLHHRLHHVQVAAEVVALPERKSGADQRV